MAIPDDYWRMTPNCLRRQLSPYAARVSGYQGYHAFPHTVMGVGLKAPVAFDCIARLERLVKRLSELARADRSEPCLSARRLRRRASMIYRSKGERRQIAGYYEADFTIDFERGRGSTGPRAIGGGSTPWRPAETRLTRRPGAASGED